MASRRCGAVRVRGACVAGLVLAAIAAVGCLGPSGEEAPATPGGLTASAASFDVVHLSWNASVGAATYDLAFRFGEMSPETVARGLDFGGGAPAMLFYVDAIVPENVELGFRVRAVSPGGLPSRWSPEAAVARGLRPASAFNASFALWPVQPGTPVQLSWQRGSTIADEAVLERRAVRGSIETVPWVRLPGVGVADVSYLDPDVGAWVDGNKLEYRLRYVLGATESEIVGAETEPATVLPPTGLAASALGGLDIHLAWTPASEIATAQLVQRGGWTSGAWEDLATLGPAVAAYDDTVPASGGYSYRVVARAAGFGDGVSVAALAATPTGPLYARFPELPDGTPVDRDAEGLFTVVAVDASFNLHAYLPDVSGWLVHDLGGDLVSHWWVAPPYLLAADGTVHLLYTGSGSGGLHDWRDGGGWHTEALPFVPDDAAIDAAGALHLVVCGNGVDLTYATNGSGDWATEAVPHSAFAEDCAIAVGADGEPRLAYTAPRPVSSGSSTIDDVGLVAHGTSGWQDEAVPVGASGIHRYPDVFRLLAVAGGVTLILDSGVIAGGTIDAYDRGPGGWIGPVRIVTGPRDLAMAVSPDGTRVAVVWYGYPDADAVALREGAAPWTTWPLLLSGRRTIGFTPAGNLWVAMPVGYGTSLVYEEP